MVSYSPSEVTKSILVAETQAVTIYAVDIANNTYIPGAWGSAKLDGVLGDASNGRILFLGVEVGLHFVELISIPAEMAFDHWVALSGDSWVGCDIASPYSSTTYITTKSGGPGGLVAYLKSVVAPTAITIAAPDKVLINTAFTVSGALTRTDTNAGIAGMTISVYYNGTGIGSGTTGTDGSYSISCSIPSVGTFTLKSSFAGATIGSVTYGGSAASVPVTVEVAPSIPLWKIGVVILAILAIAGGGAGAHYIAKRRKREV